MSTTIDSSNFALMKNIELLCRESIISIGYSSHLNDLLIDSDNEELEIGNDLWIYCKTSCASIGITKWCSVFGSKKGEKTHWEKVNLIDHSHVIKKILDEVNITGDDWLVLRDNALKVRDKFIAHNDFLHSVPNIYKNLAPYRISANIVRDSILSLLSNGAVEDIVNERYRRQVVKIPSSVLEEQIKRVFEQGVANANKR